MTSEEVYNLEQVLRERLGTETLLDNLLLAMSIDQREDLLTYIARNFDVPYGSEGGDGDVED